MKDRILMIIPTRDRHQKHLEVITSWEETEQQHTDLLFCLDADDEHKYSRYGKVNYTVSPRMRMIPTLNAVAFQKAYEYDYIGFMGDDHRFRTPNSDSAIITFLRETRNGIAYGNDLIQGERMCTAVFMDANIIRKLGYMAPPGLIHLVADVFWKKLGEDLGTLKYFNDVIIEHMHFCKEKSEKDAIYTEVNDKKMYEHDHRIWNYYLENIYNYELQKLV